MCSKAQGGYFVRIIIVGDGKVGLALIEMLAEQEHENGEDQGVVSTETQMQGNSPQIAGFDLVEYRRPVLPIDWWFLPAKCCNMDESQIILRLNKTITNERTWCLWLSISSLTRAIASGLA